MRRRPQRDVAPERPYNQERFTLPASVSAAAAAHERGPHTELRVVRAVRAEMLCLSGLSVAFALALLPGSGEALKEGECEGKPGGEPRRRLTRPTGYGKFEHFAASGDGTGG